jgi:hypothetical protein
MAFLLQVGFLAMLALYLGITAIGALRSGEITVYVRYNRDRRVWRRRQPAAYWIAVGGYLLFAVACAFGIVFRIYLAATAS